MCFSPFLHWVPPFTLLTPGNFLWTFFCHCRSSTFFYYSSYQSVLWLIINSLNIGQKSAKTWGWIADFIFIHDAIVVPVVGKQSEYSTDYNVYSIPVFLLSPLSPFAYVRAKSLQSCPALCDPMDCSSPGSFVHGILQARILEWAMPSSRGSSQPKGWTVVSHIAGGFFTIWATREAHKAD